MARQDWAGLPDGAPICELPSGLVIVRYRKHDPLPEGMTLNRARPFRRRGDDVSTFLPTWPLERVVRFIEQHVGELSWELEPGVNRRVEIPMNEPVGLVAGSNVHTIRISSDGRYLHAYPVEDR